MLKGEKMVKIYLKGKEKEYVDVSFWSILKGYVLSMLFLNILVIFIATLFVLFFF